MIVNCPVCQSEDTDVLETRKISNGTVDRRRHRCCCGVRWTSRSMIEPGSVDATRSVSKLADGATGSVEPDKPDATRSASHATRSVGGVGGGLPPGHGPISLVPDPASPSLVLSNPDQTDARTKKQAKAPGPFAPMRDAFVEAWRVCHRDAYLFETKDATNLAAMIKRHPGTVERWPEMLERYFASDFWGKKRHPLWGLATNPNEFAGEPANGLPAKVAASRKTTRTWVERNAR